MFALLSFGCFGFLVTVTGKPSFKLFAKTLLLRSDSFIILSIMFDLSRVRDSGARVGPSLTPYFS